MLVINDNLKTAIQASLKAGEVIMEVYNSIIEVEYKDDKSPLTEADKRANDVINSYLVKTGFPVISEENRQTDYEVRKDWNTCWVVDPVDGTKEFIKRNGEFTVNIAFVANGKPEYGVIYVPVVKTLYFADVVSKQGYKSVLKSHDSSIEEVFHKSTLLKPKDGNSSTVKVIGSPHI